MLKVVDYDKGYMVIDTEISEIVFFDTYEQAEEFYEEWKEFAEKGNK